MKIRQKFELPNPNSRWVSAHDIRQVIEYLLDVIDSDGNGGGSINPEEILNLISFKNPVPTFDDISKQYPNPKQGFVIMTLDTLTMYVYDGTEWVEPVPKIEYATDEDIQALFNDK